MISPRGYPGSLRGSDRTGAAPPRVLPGRHGINPSRAGPRRRGAPSTGAGRPLFRRHRGRLQGPWTTTVYSSSLLGRPSCIRLRVAGNAPPRTPTLPTNTSGRDAPAGNLQHAPAGLALLPDAAARRDSDPPRRQLRGRRGHAVRNAAPCVRPRSRSGGVGHRGDA